MRRLSVRLVTGCLATCLLLASCGSDGEESIAPSVELGDATTAVEPTVQPTQAPDEAEPVATAVPVGDGLFPTVVAVDAAVTSGATWKFNVTLLSEYDSPERYADAWRVLDGDDNELGIRVLGHDHAGEQPFTRSHTIEVPAGVTAVFVEGRDQLNGWSGERFELQLS